MGRPDNFGEMYQGPRIWKECQALLASRSRVSPAPVGGRKSFPTLRKFNALLMLLPSSFVCGSGVLAYIVAAMLMPEEAAEVI